MGQQLTLRSKWAVATPPPSKKGLKLVWARWATRPTGRDPTSLKKRIKTEE